MLVLFIQELRGTDLEPQIIETKMTIVSKYVLCMAYGMRKVSVMLTVILGV
jgi:hypothetical protein